MAVAQAKEQNINQPEEIKDEGSLVTPPVSKPKQETEKVEITTRGDAVPAGTKRLSVEEDYRMGSESGGLFVYPSNLEKFKRLSDPTTVTKAVGETIGEAGILDVEQTTPVEKRVEEEIKVAEEIAAQPLEQEAFLQRIRDGQVDEVSKEFLTRSLYIKENSDMYPPEVVQQAEEGLGRAQRYYEQRRQAKQDSVSPVFEGPTGEFQPTPAMEKDPELMSEGEKRFTGDSVVLASVKGKFAKKGFTPDQESILEDLVVENISTGEFWDLAVERINEGAIRGTALYLPDLASNAINGINSVLTYGAVNIAAATPFSTVKEYAGVPQEGITLRDAWKISEPRRKAFKQSWDALIADTLGIKTVTKVYNDYFYEKLQEKVESGEKIGGVVLDQAAFDELTTVIDPKTQQPIRREFLGEEDIFRLMSDVTMTLSEDQRWGLSVVDSALIVGPSIAAKVKASKAAFTRLQDDIATVRKTGGDAAAHIEGMDDLAAYWALKSDKRFRRLIRTQNEKELVFAIEDEHAREGFSRLQTRVKNLDDEIADKSRKLTANNPELIKLVRERESLGLQLTRARFFHNVPTSILKATAKQTLPLSFAQFYAGEYFTKFFEGDRLTAEAVGSIGYLTVGRGSFKILGYGASRMNLIAGDVGNQLLMGVEHALDLVRFEKITGRSAVGLLSDEDVTKYAEALRSRGEKVTTDHIRTLNWIRKLSSSLSPESREVVGDYMQELADLRDTILDMYPEGSPARMEAAEQLKLSIATVSGLSWMDAAAKLANGKVRMGKIASFDAVNEVQAMHELHDETIKRGNLIVSKWRETLEGITDPDSRAELTRYIESLQEGIAKSQAALIDNVTDTKEKVAAIKKIMLADTFEGVDDAMLNALNEVELNMALKLNPELDELAERNRIARDTLEMLEERADSLKYMHGSLRTTNQVTRAFESVVNVVWRNMKDNARRGFVELDKMAVKNKRSVDVSDAIKTMFGMAKNSKQDNTTSLSDFFSRDSKFFGGALGKRARKAFNDMAYRALKDMNPETYNKLKALHSTPGTEYYIDLQGREVTPLDIAMWYQDRGQLGAFNALPGEVIDIESAFREYAARVGDKGLAALYKGYSKTLEKTVEKSVPEFYKQWKQAKAIMKREWFDRLRIDGPVNKLQNNQTGVKSNKELLDNGNEQVDVSDVKIGDSVSTQSVNVVTESFSYTYKGPVNPANLLKSLSKKIETAFSGRRDSTGGLPDVAELQEEFRSIMAEISGRSSVSGQPVFDASDENQMALLGAVSAILETYVYDVWGRNAQSQLRAAGTAQDVTGLQYTPVDLDMLDEVQNALKFALELPDGTTRVFSPVNLTRILLLNNSIVDEIGKNRKAAAAVVEGRKGLEAKMDDVVKAAMEKKKIVTKGAEAINKAFYRVNKDGASFIDEFVNTGSPNTIDNLMDQALKNLVGEDNFKNGKFNIDIDGIEYDARDVVSEGMANLTVNGILEISGMIPVSGKPLTGFIGEEQTLKMVTSPERLVAMFEGDNGEKFRSNLIRIFSRGDMSDAEAVKRATKHVETIESITRFLNISQKSDISSFKTELTNIFRAPGVNWFMSRGFNWKRGQVSTPYIMGELAVAIATSAGIDLMKMAATDVDAAPYMLRLMQFPKTMTKRDMDLISSATMDFVQSEMARLGMNILDFIPEGTPEDVKDTFLGMLTSEEE